MQTATKFTKSTTGTMNDGHDRRDGNSQTQESRDTSQNPDKRIVIVTGGFGAIGDTIARRLECEGHVAVRTGRSGGSGGIKHDVRNSESWAGVIRKVLSWHGRIDGLVNAAGQLGQSPQDVMSATHEQWHALLDTHVVGSWLGCVELIRRRPRAMTSIVNVASTAGQLATPAMVAYGAMKAAVIHLTKSVALHCARSGLPIRCNAVAPALVDGGVRDDVLATIPADDRSQAMSMYLSRVPTGRLIEPDEVADVVVTLLNPRGGTSLTGQVVALAGGLGLA